MPVDLTFGAAIIVGLLGSSHCLGMCGGIVAALNMGV
ncbi:MAG: sulfite exporter TauE/SafE family protein, partial [Gammaproteobacteria bacterium]|nr:sulfite exporter TauE/SafE family protein [Gammaproteobacteria bacterium]